MRVERLPVAMLAAMPYPSGQGTQALVGEISRGLVGRGHEVHLICYGHAAFRRDEPFKIHRLRKIPGYARLRSGPDALKPLLDTMLTRRAVEVIRRTGCRLIHAHNYEGALAGWAAGAICGVPLVYHAHNLMYDELPSYFGSWPMRAMAAVVGRGLDLLVPRLAKRVIVMHRRLADALVARGVPPEKIELVEPGIDTDFFTPQWPVDDRDFSPGPTVAYTGNLDAYQNLPVLFEAMRRVEREIPASRLLLATPNDPRTARRLAARHGVSNLTEIEVVRDAQATRAVLHRCRVAATPRSSWSGFPLKNLNAAAAGVPLVTAYGSAYGIEPGRTGLVVADRDPAAFARALCELLAHPDKARAMGAAGRRLVERRYSLDRMLRGIEQVWMAARA